MSEPTRVVLAIPHELLRVAEGHPVTLGTTDGEDVLLRLPTVEEFKAAAARGREWLRAQGIEPPPPASDDQIRELVRPIGGPS